MVETLRRSPVRWPEAAGVFALLLAVAFWIYSRALAVLPLGGDNLYVLSWVNRVPGSALVRLDPVIYPEWRPIPYATLWLQYQWQRLDLIAPYHAVNIVFWVIGAWLVYQLVVRLTSSRLAAIVVAGLVLTDVRAITAQVNIIERQTTLATMFGLGAMWIVFANQAKRMSAGWCVALGLLCLSAALSKEYGLAFAGAIFLYGLIERRRDLPLAAAASVAVYFAARWTFAHGATGLYCEYMGYFFEVRKVCYDGVTATGLTQMTYNVVATGVGTVLPGLLTADGQIAVAPMRLAASLGLLAIAAIGWWRGPRELRLAALVILGNTVLNFMVYGGRNQLAAVCVFGLVLGSGLATLDQMLRTRSSPALRAAGIAALALLLCVQTWRTRVETDQQVNDILQLDPCTEILRTEQHDPVFIRAVKARFGMSDPDCQGR